METQQFNIIGSQSVIDWVGRKVTGAHNGTIAIKEGTLLFDNDRLAGGRFVIDTRSIKILDITDPATNAQFAGHLASDDFFSSEQYPEATFQITQAEPRGNGSYHVTGDLTIKDIIHSIGFDAQVNRSGNAVTASGKITVDRTKFGIKFRSGNFFLHLGDNLIYNNFDLNTHLVAEAVAQAEPVAQPATL
ncbi:MAG: YceI family protein [Cytophagales bacterium]|nr:YceI family protein [Cytophagales bacterium]